MKKIVLALIVVLIAAYCGLWYHGANEAKSRVEEKWNEWAKTAQEDGYILENDGMTIAGFPIAYAVKINNPRLKATKTTEDFQEVNLDGVLRIGSSVWGSKYFVKKNGNLNIHKKEIEDHKKIDAHYILSGDAKTTIHLTENSPLHDFWHPFKDFYKRFKDDPDGINFSDIDNISFYANNLKLVNADIPNVNLLVVDKYNTDISLKDLENGMQNLNIQAHLVGFESLLGEEEYYKPSQEHSLQDVAMLMSVPRAGKTNIALDLNFKAPFKKFDSINSGTKFSEIPAFDLNVGRLDVSNDFATVTGLLHFNLSDVVNGSRKIHFDLKSDTNVTKAQYENLKTQWAHFMDNFPICGGNAAFEDQTQNEEVCQSTKDIIPDWTALGPIVHNVDVDYEFKDLDDPLKNSMILVKNVDFYSKLYGVKSSGKIFFNEPNPYSINYQIHLLNYKQYVNDVLKYLNRVGVLIPYFIPDSKIPNFSEAKIQAVQNFVRTISDNPKTEDNDLTITIQNDNGDYKIGTLTIEQLVQEMQAVHDKFVPAKPAQPKQE